MTSPSIIATRFHDRAALEVRGSERISWLNGLVTCELAKLGPGEGAYGLIVEKKGRIQADLFVVPAAAGDAVVLAVPAAAREALAATLDHYLVMEDAEVAQLELAFHELHGPGAAEVAAASGAPYRGTLPQLGGAIVAAPADDAAFVERLGRALADAGGAIVDEAAWEALRIERGLPRFGVEFDATLYPQEAALEKVAVSFDKGCYLGQEVVYMLENRGHVKRKLVPLEIDGDGVLAPGTPVTTPDGAPTGEVKSAALGPTTRRLVAIAMVKWAHAKPGTELRVGDRTARVRG
jgi:folate-binding protein YgfZ